MTLTEAQAHFSMWAMFSSLLLATNDIRERNPDIEGILMNKEVIAINQDLSSFPAIRINTAAQPWRRYVRLK